MVTSESIFMPNKSSTIKSKLLLKVHTFQNGDRWHWLPGSKNVLKLSFWQFSTGRFVEWIAMVKFIAKDNHRREFFFIWARTNICKSLLRSSTEVLVLSCRGPTSDHQFSPKLTNSLPSRQKSKCTKSCHAPNHLASIYQI